MQGKCRTILLAVQLCLALSARTQTRPKELHLPRGPVTLQAAFDSSEKQQIRNFTSPQHNFDHQQVFNSSGTMTLEAFIGTLKKMGLECERPDSVTIIVKAVKKPPVKTQQPALPPHSREFDIRVTDELGFPLPGATIENLETHMTAETDALGHLHLTTKADHLVIKVTHINRASVQKLIRHEGAVNILLAPSAKPLDEVFVDYAGGTPRTTTNDRDKITGIQLTIGNPQTTLEGQVAGLIVTQSSGIAGGSVYLTIRGQSSILNGSDPLYIIDGTPYGPQAQSVSNIIPNNSANSLNPFSFINLADIDRIEVLKDADATAIYGSRGANGVILITTKQWKTDLPRLDFQTSAGFSEISKRPVFMNAQQFITLRQEAFQNDGITPDAAHAPDLAYPPTNRSKDWGRYAIGAHAQTNEQQLSIAGERPRYNYLIGFNRSSEDNVFPTRPNHNLINTWFNLNHRSKNGRFDAHLSGLFAWDYNNQYMLVDPTQLQLLAPNELDPMDGSGNLAYPGHNIPYLNPWNIFGETYKATSRVSLASATANYRLFRFLTFKTILGGNIVQSEEAGRSPIRYQPPAPAKFADAYSAFTRYMSTAIEPQIEYHDTLGRLKLSWLGGASWQTQTDTMHALTGYYLSDSSLGNPANAFVNVPDSERLPYRYTAYFTRIYGILDDKYVFDLTGRRDGTNRFNPKEQFGNFGAIGLAWIFSGEKFIQNHLPVLSFGKLRGNYGITGNDQIGDRGLQLWSPTALQPFKLIPSFYNKSTIQAGRAWEQTRKLEASLDLGFENDRYMLNLTWYRHRSSNMLIADQPSPGSTSILFHNANVVLQNQGWEATISARIIEHKDFTWTLSLNASLPASKLISFPGLTSTVYDSTLFIGRSVNTIKGYVLNGVNPTTGIYQFKTGNPKDSLPEYTDKTFFGKLDVFAFGGMDNQIRWKKVLLDILIDARVQNDVNYLSAMFANNPPGGLLNGVPNFPRALDNRWRSSGDNAKYEKATTSKTSGAGLALGFYNQSNALLTRGSFVRLRKVSFSYQLPSSWTTRCRLASAWIFLNAQNLFTLSPLKDVDPEVPSAFTLPTLRTITAGIHITM